MTFLFSDLIMDQLVNNKMLEEDLKEEIRQVFILHHTFAHQRTRRRSLMPGDVKKSFSRGKAQNLVGGERWSETRL